MCRVCQTSKKMMTGARRFGRVFLMTQFMVAPQAQRIAHICDANHLIPIRGPLSTEEELLPQNKHDVNRPNRIPMETYGLDI